MDSCPKVNTGLMKRLKKKNPHQKSFFPTMRKITLNTILIKGFVESVRMSCESCCKKKKNGLRNSNYIDLKYI